MQTVKLEREEWAQVLAVLANGPWTVVNPLIMKMGDQLRQQAEAEAAALRAASNSEGKGEAPGPDRTN